jgi:hypothetical protein
MLNKLSVFQSRGELTIVGVKKDLFLVIDEVVRTFISALDSLETSVSHAVIC